MARPKKQTAEKRTQQLNIRYTVAELEIVRAHAENAGLSVSEFQRRRGLGLPVTPSRSRTDPALVVALNRVGNNVNQLARSVYRGSAFQRYWHEVGGELRTVLHRTLEGIDG